MSKFQISPNLQFGIGLAVTLLTVFAKGSVAMPMGVPPVVGQYLDSWSNFLLIVYAPVATFMAAYSSSQPGWLAPATPVAPPAPPPAATPVAPPAPPPVAPAVPPPAAPAVPPVAKTLVFALAGALAALALVAAPRAEAAPKAAYAPRLAAAAPVKALAANPLNAIGDWATADVATALAASTRYANLDDEVGKTCLTEISTLATMIHDHPLPITFHLATDIEYARLDQAELNRICKVPECAQVWQDMGNAAKALEIIPLPISFASICGKVPIVGLTMTATATPAPTPSPSPTVSPTPAPTVSPTPTPTR